MARGLLCHPSSPGSGAPRTLRGQRGDAVGYFAGIGAGPPHGRRPVPNPSLRNLRHGVSIRASAREATRSLKAVSFTCPCFNPRLRTGGDSAWHEFGAPKVFQSAPPHGRRHELHPSVLWIRRTFQSAPPHGRRRAGTTPGRSPTTFQSAPPHGRRRVPPQGSATRPLRFQSAPPHGRRLVVRALADAA